jgi:hypothetical protein
MGSVISSSRTSLFSPGSTLRGSSPGFGNSQYEWSKQSIDAINKGASQNQPFTGTERRGMKRMISLDTD